MTDDPTTTLFFAKGSCAFGSIVGLEWLGQPYRLVRTQKSDHTNPAYRRFNPTGEVPTLLVGDRTISESVAILHHVGSRDPRHSLVPAQGTAAFDQFNQILGYLVTSVHPGFAPFFHADRLGGPTQAAQRAVHEAGLARLPERYERIEALLSATGWLVGDAPTLADAYLIGIIRWGDDLINQSPYANLRALRDRLAQDPAVRFAQAVEDGDAASPSGAFQGFVKLDDL